MRTIRNKANLVAFMGSAWQMVLPDPADHGEYQGRFVQYDAFQMFKHALAIYNFAFENPEEQRWYLRRYFDGND